MWHVIANECIDDGRGDSPRLHLIYSPPRPSTETLENLNHVHHQLTQGKFMSRHYWGYRIDVKLVIAFFRNELENGRLRQGWGWDDRQNLRDLKADWGARRNLNFQ